MLSIPQILSVAANAGFTGNDLATATAIALAESSPPGNEQSYNPETAAAGGTPAGQGSYGLWQIYWKKHQNFDRNQLYDPQYNANAAYAIYSAKGNSFTDWSTFNYGQYLTYMPGVLAAIGQPSPVAADASTVNGAGVDTSINGSGTSDTAMLVTIGALALELWFLLRG